MAAIMIFAKKGTVAAIPDQVGQYLTLPVYILMFYDFVVSKERAIMLNNTNFLINTVRIESDSGAAFVHTLSDLIYIYSFGERIGTLTIGGITLESSILSTLSPLACDAEGTTLGPTIHGFEQIQMIYNRNNTSMSPMYAMIAIGNLQMLGFLTNIVNEFTNDEKGLGSFKLEFKIVPGTMTAFPLL